MEATALERELSRLRQRHDENPDGRGFAPLADCYRKLGRREEALALLRIGLERHPEYTAARVIQGKTLRDHGHEFEARCAFELVLELDADNLVARRQCALISEAMEELELARGHWERLRAVDTTQVEAEAALLRLGEDDPEEVEPEPAAAEPLSSAVADENAASGGFARGEVAVLEAKLDPDDDEDPPSALPEDPDGIVTETLARIYREQGFLAKALEIYRQLDPRRQNEEYQAAIQELSAELGRERPLDEPASGADLLIQGETEIDELVPDTPAMPVAEPVEETAAAPADDRPEAPAESLDPHGDVEDFDKFRTWLDRIKVR